MGWRVARQFGRELRDGRVARVERVTLKDEEAAWSIFERYDDKCLSFTDCTSFVVVQRLDLPLCLVIDADFRAFGLHCLPDAHGG